MDIMNTPIGMDIQDIIDTGDKYRPMVVEAEIHCGDVTISALKVLNKHDYEDFVKGYTVETDILLVIPAGKYASKVIPNKDNLEITFRTKILNLVTNDVDTRDDKAISAETFRAVLKTPADTDVGSRNKVSYDEFTKDISDVEVVEFQLIGKAMEQFSLKYCGGIYRKTKVEDLIKTLLVGESATLDLESDYKPKGVGMLPAFDVKPRETYVIPHGTAVKDAPGYIQRELGGVYAAGLSYFYFQDDYWYVYPTFDYTRYEQATKKLIVYRVPDGKLPQVERTFKTVGGVLSILATEGANFVDKSETDKIREGNGVRFTNASTLFNETITVKNNKATYKRKDQASEFISTERLAKLNNVTSNAVRITTNNLYEASKLAKRDGMHISFIWENSDPSLIYPGMQAKFVYYADDEVKEAYGVVICKETGIIWTGTGLTAGTYIRKTIVHLFVKKEEANAQ